MKTALNGMTMVWNDGTEEFVSNNDLGMPDIERGIERHWELDEYDYEGACEEYVEELNADLEKENEGYTIISFHPIYEEIMSEYEYREMLREQERENRYACLGTAYEY